MKKKKKKNYNKINCFIFVIVYFVSFSQFSQSFIFNKNYIRNIEIERRENDLGNKTLRFSEQ